MTDTVTLGNLLVLLGVIGGVATLLMHARKVRRENEADARGRSDEILAEVRTNRETIDNRVTKVETRIADFMPRSEIEGKVEHEKNNRSQADEFLRARIDKHDEQITQTLVEVGRLHERGVATDAALAEIKALLKEIPRELGARLDKLGDQVAHGGRS